MPNSTSHLIVGAAALLVALGACTRSDASPSPARASVPASLSAGAAQTGGAQRTGPIDSVSEQADRGRIRGAASAGLWLIEISDFQCPFCKQWHDETFAVIQKEYVQTGKVRLAYLNFPLTSIHRNARAAAEAAMCASVQGKFWELHDSLFDTQRAWEGRTDPMPLFDSLAVAAQANPAAWRRCMTTHATGPIIDADLERSRQAGVQSTPSFFIGDKSLAGAYPVDSFRVAIEQQLAAKAAPAH